MVNVSTLDTLDRGSRGEILAIASPRDAACRLRRMGLREGVVVEVMTNHDPVMLRFEGCCLAVERCMLKGVTICRCGCEKEDARSRSSARARGVARRDSNH